LHPTGWRRNGHLLKTDARKSSPSHSTKTGLPNPLKTFDDQLEMYEKLGFEKDCVAQLRKIVERLANADKMPVESDT